MKLKLNLIFFCSLIIIVIITTIGFLPQSLFVPQKEIKSFFYKANVAVAEEDYKKAIHYYKKALELNMTASVHYNLANTYRSNNQIGKAVIHYEKALLLNPYFSEAKYNLKQLRQKAQLPEKQKSIWMHFIQWLPSSLWLFLVIISFWIVITSTGWLFLSKTKSSTIFIFLILFILIHLTSLSALMGFHFRNNYVVILGKDIHLQVAPALSSPKLQPLKEGEIVMAKKYYRDYLLAKPFSGKTGWIPIKSTGKINE